MVLEIKCESCAHTYEIKSIEVQRKTEVEHFFGSSRDYCEKCGSDRVFEREKGTNEAFKCAGCGEEMK